MLKEIFTGWRYWICRRSNKGNPDILLDLIEKDFLPIVCPIGLDEDFHGYNINADDAASAIAEAVNAVKIGIPYRYRRCLYG